jgi:hypothetical protein
MANQIQHKRNCPAIWRGWPLTLTDFVPEDAPCTCGAEERAAARSNAERRGVERQAA